MSGRSDDRERGPARRNARDRPRRRSRPGRRAGWARLRRLAEKHQTFRIAPVDPPLGHDPVHRDIPALGPDGLHPGQLVADADDDGLSRQAREGSVEEPAPVAEAIAGFVPAIHRHQRGGGDDGIGARRLGNAVRAGRKGHARMPLAEDERLPGRDDHGERGHRTARSQPLDERSRVVLPPDRPAEGELRGGKARKRAPEMGVDALVEALARGRVETLTRGDQPVALALPPGFHVGGGHAASRRDGSPSVERLRQPLGELIQLVSCRHAYLASRWSSPAGEFRATATSSARTSGATMPWHSIFDRRPFAFTGKMTRVEVRLGQRGDGRRNPEKEENTT